MTYSKQFYINNHNTAISIGRSFNKHITSQRSAVNYSGSSAIQDPPPNTHTHAASPATSTMLTEVVGVMQVCACRERILRWGRTVCNVLPVITIYGRGSP